MQAYLLPRASNATQTPTSGALPGHAFGEYIFDALAAKPAPSAQALGLMTVPPPPQPPAPEVAQLRIASFDASYDMAFYFRDGRVLRESERETYATRKIGGRWLIVENRDYLR